MASKNNPKERGEGGPGKTYNGKKIKPILYIGTWVGHGRYMAAQDEGGEIIMDKDGRPSPTPTSSPEPRARTMAIDKTLLEILACPVSKKPVTLSDDGQFLVCRESKLVYRIEDDIPIMLADEAIPLDEWEKSQASS